MTSYQNKVLLFSSPRSGSTFLSNVIRSHPEVMFFNEIFTRAPQLLPNFEKSFQLGAQERWRTAFEEDMKHLFKYKLPYYKNILHRYRFIKAPTFFAIKLFNSIVHNWRKDYWGFLHKAYHINALVEPPFEPFWITQFPKRSNPSVLFFKDVRMPKAYFAVKSMYPHTYFIYLVRNPFFVVASEIRRRTLHEVMQWLDKDYLCSRFRQPELVNRFLGVTPEHTFALLWRLVNELILHDIQTSPPDNLRIVRYEDCVRDPIEEAHRIFDFIGLQFHPNTIKYLLATENPKLAVRHHDRSTFIGSNLNSKIKEPALTKDQIDHIAEVLDGSPLMKFWQE